MNRETLDAALIAAHAADDRRALVTLYRDAAESAASPEAAAFYLTHAYVFALDTGHPETGALHARLKQQGREE